MRKLYTIIICFIALTLHAQERLIVVDEGLWQQDNGRLSYFEDGKVVSNQWFRDMNGKKLGDTPNDIIQINDSLIAITINWSNIVEFIRPNGKEVTATENIPNNRRMATDGRYLYVSSYGHECETVDGMQTFEKGYVAKIDTRTFKCIAATEVGYEPEGIAYYNGHLFVANTGGYAFQEAHDYESTVSILDANSMKFVKNVDTGVINLYGTMSQAGRYLCINSPGDYYEVDPQIVIFDCQRALDGEEPCFVTSDNAATYNTTTRDGKFYAIGSNYKYSTNEYHYNYLLIDPETAITSEGSDGLYDDELPGTVVADLQKMENPYGVYVNPYTGYIYAADAGGYTEGGMLYQWNPNGDLQGKWDVYINPGHFLALLPNGMSAGISNIKNDVSPHAVYDLQGRKIAKPQAKGIYIVNGKKVIKK